MSWYVLRCREGQEKQLLRSLRNHLSKEILEDAFVFTHERMKKYRGEWHKEKMNMYPNYIFLESSNGRVLSENLKQFQSLADVLENEKLLLPVTLPEELFLRKLCGTNHHLGISKGVMSEKEIQITEGPLKGNEQWIWKIDLHKRIAKLKTPDLKLCPSGFSSLREIWAGVELISGDYVEKVITPGIFAKQGFLEMPVKERC